jgi:hypothetical protein
MAADAKQAKSLLGFHSRAIRDGLQGLICMTQDRQGTLANATGRTQNRDLFGAI